MKRNPEELQAGEEAGDERRKSRTPSAGYVLVGKPTLASPLPTGALPECSRMDEMDYARHPRIREVRRS